MDILNKAHIHEKPKCLAMNSKQQAHSVWSVCFDWREACLPSWCNRKHYGRVSQRYRFESRRGQWALFSLTPSALSFVFLWHTNTHTHTLREDFFVKQQTKQILKIENKKNPLKLDSTGCNEDGPGPGEYTPQIVAPSAPAYSTGGRHSAKKGLNLK